MKNKSGILNFKYFIILIIITAVIPLAVPVRCEEDRPPDSPPQGQSSESSAGNSTQPSPDPERHEPANDQNKQQEKPKAKTNTKQKQKQPKKTDEDKKVQPEEKPPEKDPGEVIKASLPDVSAEEIQPPEAAAESNKEQANTETLIKGIISWILIAAGAILIISVIITNLRIPKHSDIRVHGSHDSRKDNKKHRIYYSIKKK